MESATSREIGLSDDHLVLDASALVDLLLAESLGAAVDRRIAGAVLHAPAHLDAEVLSGLGRLHRSGQLTTADVTRQVEIIESAPIQRHALAGLLQGAWKRRDRIRLADALYVELATVLALPLVTTDARLARAVRNVEVIVP